MSSPRKPASPFRYFNSSPEVIRLVVMMYVKYPLFRPAMVCESHGRQLSCKPTLATVTAQNP